MNLCSKLCSCMVDELTPATRFELSPSIPELLSCVERGKIIL